MMKKIEAEKLFLEIYPNCKEWDRGEQTLTWNEWTDNLNRDGEISDTQRNNWLYPRYFKKYK